MARTSIPAEASAGAASLQKQIDNLSGQVTHGFDRLESLLISFDGRVRKVEQFEAGCNSVLTSRMDAAWHKLEQHETAIDGLITTIGTMNKVVMELVHTNRILKWLLAVFVAIAMLVIGEIIRGNLLLVKP